MLAMKHDPELDAGPRRMRSGPLHQLQLELDQPCVHIVTSWVVGQNAEDIASVAGAHADDADGTRRCAVECGADQSLHDTKPPCQGPVALVPLVPVEPLAQLRAGIMIMMLASAYDSSNYPVSRFG